MNKNNKNKSVTNVHVMTIPLVLSIYETRKSKAVDLENLSST